MAMATGTVMALAKKNSKPDTASANRDPGALAHSLSFSCAHRCLAQAQAIALLLSVSATVQAQSEVEPAASAVAPRRFSVVPTFSASMTLTDNARLSAADGRSDLITQLSPGVQISSNSGRLRGYFNYSLNALAYARDTSSNAIQHALNAAATIEAIEGLAYMDVAGTIAQQAVSAYGTQSSDNALANANRTAVSTYRLSPYVRGRLSDLAEYEARLTYSESSNGSTLVANDVKSSTALVRIGGASALRAVGWSADATHQAFDYQSAGSAHSDRLRGILNYAVTPELRVSVIGGNESQNFGDVNTQSRGTSGWGVEWTPTERTRLSATSEQRFFGNSHSISFEHRTPRTVWKYTDSRDLSTGFDQLRLGSLGTAYDLYFAQFASLEPDPVARAALVDKFLQSNGIAPNTVVLGGSMASTALVQRRQDLSFAWAGLRDTLTILISQARGERADGTVLVADDFANGNIVRQRGFSLVLAHRMTPQSSLNVTASLQNSSGSADTRTSKLRSVLLGWTGRLGPRTSVSLSGRHSRGDSAAESYVESAVIATLSLQF